MINDMRDWEMLDQYFRATVRHDNVLTAEIVAFAPDFWLEIYEESFYQWCKFNRPEITREYVAKIKKLKAFL